MSAQARLPHSWTTTCRNPKTRRSSAGHASYCCVRASPQRRLSFDGQGAEPDNAGLEENDDYRIRLGLWPSSSKCAKACRGSVVSLKQNYKPILHQLDIQPVVVCCTSFPLFSLTPRFTSVKFHCTLLASPGPPKFHSNQSRHRISEPPLERLSPKLPDPTPLDWKTEFPIVVSYPRLLAVEIYHMQLNN